MFLLHVTYPSGRVQTVACVSAFVRGLWIISLAGRLVTLRCEDRAVAA